jgi:hypothetical protein
VTTEEDLRRLAALRDAGELTPAEYEQAVAVMRREAPAPRALDGSQPWGQTATQPSFGVPFTAAPTSLPPAPPARSSRSPWAVAGVVLVIIVGAIVWNNAGAPQRALEELAADTCQQLDDAIVLQVGYILGDAIDDAEELGFSGFDLGDEMRSACPLTMAAMESLTSDY